MAIKTRAQINADADTLLADNTTRDISPADIRGRIKDLADSAVNGIGALAPAARKLPFFDPTGAAALADLSDFARTLLDDASAAAFYATLGEIPAAQLPGRLGETGISVEDFNLAVSNGFYKTTSAATNGPLPVGAGNGSLLVIAYTNVWIWQIASYIGTNVSYQRKMLNGSWGSWTRLVSYADILGPVSQSGGVPTGALVEVGSNSNGTYRRYADGLQICDQSLLYPDITTPAGSIFRSAAFAWAQPAAFAEIPTAVAGDLSSVIWVQACGTSVSSVEFTSFCYSPISGSRVLYLRSSGRWF